MNLLNKLITSKWYKPFKQKYLNGAKVVFIDEEVFYANIEFLYFSTYGMKVAFVLTLDESKEESFKNIMNIVVFENGNYRTYYTRTESLKFLQEKFISKRSFSLNQIVYVLTEKYNNLFKKE